jgi:hypothetical protein
MAFLKFVPITKIDAAKREVYGVVTSETPDKDGEICDYASTVPHYQAWSAEFEKATEGKSKGNVREMHTHSAVGKVAELVCDDAAKTIAVRARIVDDEAWRKCQEGVYTGFSHGGEYVGEPKPDGVFKRYTARPTEISLVDNPCNPDAHFEYVKADGTVELRKFFTAEDARDAEGSGARKAASLDSFASFASSAVKRDVSDEERKRLADEGHAMPDGSYPIANVEDLKNAIQAYGRAKDPEAVKRHIIRRAKELGHTDLLPADWSGSTRKEDTVDSADLTKAGAKHSKETLATLRQMKKSLEDHHGLHMAHHQAHMDHYAEMEKCFGKLFGDGDGKGGDGDGDADKAAKTELAKVSGERDALKAELQKAESTLQEVNEKLARLLAEPRPAKAAKNAVAVSKEEDAAGAKAKIPEGRPSATGDRDVLKACLAQPI